MTTDVVATLTREHAIQSPRIEDLRRLADASASLTASELVDGLDAAVDFLTDDLLPHARAEESVLYPTLAEVLGSPDSIATMVRDHVEIRRLVDRLRTHRDELASQLLPVARHEVQRDLYVLHALVQLHLAKEEELFFPRLHEQVGAEQADALVHRLHRAVESAVADGVIADGG